MALAMAAGCERASPPATKSGPAPAAAPEKAKLTLIVPESANWTAAEALEHLNDAKLAVSAAVRLVRLGEGEPLCVPAELTDRTASRLRVVRLDDGLWALGIVDRDEPATLHAPVLIGAEGAVTRVAEGLEEEVLTLHVSKDAKVFPHLLVAPLRVLIAALPLEPALTLESPDTVGFALREQGGFGYVALMLHAASAWVEAAKYTWDPFELSFSGPASDKLADPPGGTFELDMEKSPMLVPMGGELPKPKERTPPPGQRHDSPWDDA